MKPGQLFLSLFLVAIACSPSAEQLLDRGRSLEEEGKLDEALAIYRESVEKHPDSSGAHLQLAKMLSAREQYGEAVKHYSKAIELDPNNLEAHLNFSGYYYKRQNYLASLQHLEEVVTKAPESPEALMAGNLYRQVEADLVKSEHRKRIQLELSLPDVPSDRAATLKLEMARSYAVEGEELLAEKDERATNAYGQAVQWAPDTLSYRLGLAKALELSGKIDLAAAELEKARELDSKDPEVLLALAGMFSRGGREDEAIQLLQRLIQTAPLSLEAEFGRRRLEELERASASKEPDSPEQGARPN